jgi:oligogalacturonide transport system permease protein
MENISKKESSLSLEKKKKRTKFFRENQGYLYLLPWLIGFFAFKFYPLLSSLYYSFTDYNLFRETVNVIGVKNYQNIFNNAKTMKSFGVTFRYAFMTVPLKLVFALFIAYLLNFNIKGINVFRTIYYIPSILGGSIAISVLWQFLFQNEGLINMLLGLVGAPPINWLGSPDHALFVIVLLRAWQFGSAMVIFLAALKGVPGELYEAASLDGCGRGKQFLKITLPMISPVIFFNLVTQLVQAFQEFNAPFIITNGGPQGSTTLISMLIYQNAFKTHKMGMASAMAWLLFVIVSVFTAIAFISQKYWVYYAEDDK